MSLSFPSCVSISYGALRLFSAWPSCDGIEGAPITAAAKTPWNKPTDLVMQVASHALQLHSMCKHPCCSCKLTLQ